VLLSALALATGLQGPPATDIYLADLRTEAGRLRVGAPRNVTARPGYDNQPHFLPDGSGLLFTSIREDGQADIYRYELADGRIHRVTATPESEYSPTPVAAGIAVVRVERDSTQRLWVFDHAGGEPRLLLPHVRPVGYFAPAAAGYAVFVLGRPPTLAFARSGDTTVVELARDIGRTIARIPGREAVSFVQRIDSATAWLTELDPATRASRRLARLPAGVDFYAWMPDGTVLVGRGTKLLSHAPGTDDWAELADFTTSGLTSITRLAVSPRGDRLAIVAVPAPPP
jgi:hypothetical protein